MPETATLPSIEEAVALGLTRDEYALIVDKLGREPNEVELAMFSLLWSEHCAYKHSKGLLVTLQDLGAAGLTSSASEMASKGEVGIDLDVARVPLREADMAPFEIMVSESQERMLCVCEPAQVEAVLAVCEKW